MFAYLKGKLIKKTPVSAIIDCGGVGYEVKIPLSTFEKLPDLDQTTELKIHFSMNENEGIRLFGFFTDEEKELFNNLISISKIGPKTALSILSGLSVQDLIQAVQTGNVGLISTVPGLGKKSSERLIIELKDKVGKIVLDSIVSSSGIAQNDIIIEAETALLTLGYRIYDIRKTISKLIKEIDFKTSEEIIKTTIKHLYKKRNT
ncbi:MAG: Holliday junction branch migration protein RuvA [Candidatus Cloacimonetes bacterium]|nr:Holliday junction branch migration protein RuvA [Candidatus Cloacimonadota bacterium]